MLCFEEENSAERLDLMKLFPEKLSKLHHYITELMHHSLKYNHQFFLTGKVRVVDISISCVNHKTTASSRCLMFQYSSKIQVKLQFIGI